MATDPIPEPLTNQDISENRRAGSGVRSSATPELPPAERDANTRLKQAAAQTGHAAGRTVASVREIPRRMQEQLTGDTETGKVEEIKNRLSDAADQARQSVAETYDKTKQQAAETYRQTQVRAAELVDRARIHSRRIVDEYPLHIIAAAAMVGFALGVVLRIWRSSRYE